MKKCKKYKCQKTMIRRIIHDELRREYIEYINDFRKKT